MTTECSSGVPGSHAAMAVTLRMGIRIRAPREFVFQHLLTAHHMARWFCNFAQFDMRGPAVGSKFRFGGDYAIAAAEPPGWTCEILGGEVLRAVSFQWPLFDADTRVEWRVEDAPDGCVMRVTHDGLVREDSTCGTFHDAWRVCLGNLKAIAEGRSDSLRPDSTPPTDPTKLDLMIDASPSKVFGAFVDLEALRHWAAGGNPPSVEPRVGGKYHMGGDGDAGTILELDAPRRLVVEWPRRPLKRFALQIEEKSGGRCGVYSVHSGLALNDPGSLVRLRCEWSDRLVSLKNFLEAGDPGFTEPYLEQVLRE